MAASHFKKIGMTIVCLSAVSNLFSTVLADSPATDAIKPLPQDGKMHIYLCGTGVPVVNMQYIRKPSCLAVIAEQQFFLFDAGEGSIQTLAELGLPYTRINNVFITHWHSDHFAGLAQVANASWIDGRNTPMNVYGPYGVEQIIESLAKAYQFDTLFRAINSKHTLDPSLSTPVPHLIDAVSQDQEVYKNNDMIITAFEVDHAPVYPSLGYRLQYKGCHVTLSGDTTIIPKELDEAKNADVFISEALNVKQTMAAANKQKTAGNITKYEITKEIPDYHSDTLQLAQLAQQANVKNLVLTHMDPPFIPGADAENLFIAGMNQYYKGPIIAAKDGDELILTPEADGSCKVEYVQSKISD